MTGEQNFKITFSGNVFHLAVVTDNSENLTALLSSGGKENHLQTHKILCKWTHTDSCIEVKLTTKLEYRIMVVFNSTYAFINQYICSLHFCSDLYSKNVYA